MAKLLIVVDVDDKCVGEYFTPVVHAYNAGALLQDIYTGHIDGHADITVTDDAGEIIRESE